MTYVILCTMSKPKDGANHSLFPMPEAGEASQDSKNCPGERTCEAETYVLVTLVLAGIC